MAHFKKHWPNHTVPKNVGGYNAINKSIKLLSNNNKNNLIFTQLQLSAIHLCVVTQGLRSTDSIPKSCGVLKTVIKVKTQKNLFYFITLLSIVNFLMASRIGVMPIKVSCKILQKLR